MLFVRPHHPLKVTASRPHVKLRDVCSGEAQSLKDREILEFLGDAE